MRAANQPASWWGWHWEQPVPLSLVEILQAGNLTPRLAAMFWPAMEGGAGPIAGGGPPPRPNAPPPYLLVNEMSAPLPVYTWDSYARRAFELMAEGYSLATTVHADTVDEVLAILRGGVGVPPEQ